MSQSTDSSSSICLSCQATAASYLLVHSSLFSRIVSSLLCLPNVHSLIDFYLEAKIYNENLRHFNIRTVNPARQVKVDNHLNRK